MLTGGALLWTAGAGSAAQRAGVCDDQRVDEVLYGVLQSDMPAVHQALARGADLRMTTRCGTNALQPAICGPRSTSIESLTLLIRAGASVNHVDGHGMTPLMYAIVCGNDEAVRVLLAAGADPQISDRDGLSALDYCHECENETAEAMITRLESQTAIRNP